MPTFTNPNEESVPLHEENWIAGAIKRPGQLHRDLGVAQGKKIPKGMIASAAKKKGKVGQRARLAQTLAGFSHGSKKTKEANDCHNPPGSPAGGQFCSKGGDSWARSGGGQGGDFAATMGAANKHAAAKAEASEERLERLHGSPLTTNAAVNRQHAVRMFNAGMTPKQIADAFGKVFKVDSEGKLGQKYDAIYPDGRKETRYTITKKAVDDAIKSHRRQGGPRGTGPGLSRAKQRVARREAQQALGRTLRAHHGLPEPKK